MSDDTAPEPRIGSWWSPSGWTRAPWPTPYQEAHDAEDGDWDENFRARGYRDEGGAAPDGTDNAAIGNLVLRRHAEHLAVETWDTGTMVSLFFVAGDDVPAFRATLLLSMVQAMATAWLAEETRLLRKAAVAFIRHGGGKGTISSDGWVDKDERERQDEDFRRWQRARDAKKGDER